MGFPRLLLLAVLAVVAMSLVPVLVKSMSANEATIGLGRLFIAVAAFTPLVWWRGKLSTLSRREWLQLVCIGAVFALHWFTYFVSIKMSTAALATLAITTYGVQYPILAYFFNGERLNGFEMLAIACCFSGCFIVSPQLSLSNDTTLGIAIGLFSALLYAALPLLHQRAGQINTLARTWGQFFFALLCFLPLWFQADWSLGEVEIYKLVVLGIVCTVLAHGLWVKVTTELPAIYVSMTYYLYLPLAVVSSAVFLKEDMTVQKIAGAVLVVVSSLTLSIYRFRRQAKGAA